MEPTAIAPVTNGAADAVRYEEPYAVEVTIHGAAPLLFHGWNCEAVDEKAKARKGSKAKKEDNLESYVFRNGEGLLCLPGRYFRAAIRDTARFKQDPRSPRKSARDLFNAGIVTLTELAPIGPGAKRTWDYVHQERVVVQRNAITRMRPAFLVPWEITIKVGVTLPEYISPELLSEVIALAGRVNGLSDYRPTYGRFTVGHFVTTQF